MFEQDLIVRAIQQLGEAIARLVGASRELPPAEVLDSIEAAKGALPLVPGMIEHTDAARLFEMLGRDQCVLLAQLLDLEADALEKLKRSGLAVLRRNRARELRVLCQ